MNPYGICTVHRGMTTLLSAIILLVSGYCGHTILWYACLRWTDYLYCLWLKFSYSIPTHPTHTHTQLSNIFILRNLGQYQCRHIFPYTHIYLPPLLSLYIVYMITKLMYELVLSCFLSWSEIWHSKVHTYWLMVCLNLVLVFKKMHL